jgi:hypothetical protein
VVLARQHVEGQRLADGVLGPIGQLRIAGLPALQPGGQVGLGFLQVAPVVQPTQFLQAVVVGLARQVVQRIAQEVSTPDHFSPFPPE